MPAVHSDSRRPEQSEVRPMEWQETGVRNRDVFAALVMMHLLLGFEIAMAVGLTGIGGGSFTVPALLLIIGLPAGEAVGTAFVFAGVLRLVAAPFYLFGRQVHSRYFRLLLQGAVPGLVIGMFALHSMSKHDGSPVVVIVLGLLLTASSSITFVPRV